MARLPDWERRLADLIVERRGSPHQWGLHDCVMWAADDVLAVTGRDFAVHVRGRYADEKGAVRILVLEGVRDVAELADKYLGRRRHIALARPGDVVVGHLSTGESCLGVCYGRHSLFVGVAGGKDGLVVVDTLDLDHAYRV